MINTIKEAQSKREKEKVNDHFKTFINNSLLDLKEKGITYCYFYEQIEALKKRYKGVLRHHYDKELECYVVTVVTI